MGRLDGESLRPSRTRLRLITPRPRTTVATTRSTTRPASPSSTSSHRVQPRPGVPPRTSTSSTPTRSIPRGGRTRSSSSTSTRPSVARTSCAASPWACPRQWCRWSSGPPHGRPPRSKSPPRRGRSKRLARLNRCARERGEPQGSEHGQRAIDTREGCVQPPKARALLQVGTLDVQPQHRRSGIPGCKRMAPDSTCWREGTGSRRRRSIHAAVTGCCAATSD